MQKTETIAERRARRLERFRRRAPYRLKPDLPGMTKRLRRYNAAYLLWRGRTLLCGAVIRRRNKRRKPPPQTRELVPRPKPVRSNKKLYCRGAEHARFTYGREGIGLLWYFRWLW